MYICIHLNHCAVHLKLTQHCKATILQLKKINQPCLFLPLHCLLSPVPGWEVPGRRPRESGRCKETHPACSSSPQLLTKETSKMDRGLLPRPLCTEPPPSLNPNPADTGRRRGRTSGSHRLHPLINASALRERAAVLGPGPTTGKQMYVPLWGSRVSHDFKSVSVWQDPIMCLTLISNFQPKETSRVGTMS